VSLACIQKAEGNAKEAATSQERAMQLFGELVMSWDIAWAMRAFERPVSSGDGLTAR
jgi:hypothetical protein